MLHTRIKYALGLMALSFISPQFGRAATSAGPAGSLEVGFHQMYNLDFRLLTKHSRNGKKYIQTIHLAPHRMPQLTCLRSSNDCIFLNSTCLRITGG